LAKERKKLRDAEAGTLIEYIKTSIEILMNMRLEEYSLIQQQQLAKSKKGAGKTKEPPKIQKPGMNNTGLPLVVSHRGAGVGGDNTASSQSSFVSLDEPPKDYEMMLQKYEAEVRNHIKIEQ
jgi:hypothetical protein